MTCGSGFSKHNALFLLLLSMVIMAIETGVVRGQSTVTCTKLPSPCSRRVFKCPAECPLTRPSNPYAKACFLDCNSPVCQPVCRHRKPSCSGIGSGCYDPRFIGGDGVVFYFHGRKDEHFSLVSDPKLQINARFMGLRPVGRTRDFTWIQALGILFGPHHSALTVEAIPTKHWDDAVDHLKFSFDREDLEIAEGHLSGWTSESEVTFIRVERTGSMNSVMITVEGLAELSVTVVPITREDDKVHGYGIPSDDCYAHLDVQFRFLGLSPQVEGVLGRTYRPDFENTAKAGVAMPVVGGEDKYRTSSLVSPDCTHCVFNPTPDL
ncbi:Root cap protein [Dioscorea alata]|uniref:Root cap protein n=1 Tax=Dioscorea alata TaxID=55571 RepID=A0ACB7VP56_DIOAL|nr:Root cap protein [Dioscorea alata]